jgi:hypothetical protein
MPTHAQMFPPPKDKSRTSTPLPAQVSDWDSSTHASTSSVPDANAQVPTPARKTSDSPALPPSPRCELSSTVATISEPAPTSTPSLPVPTPSAVDESLPPPYSQIKSTPATPRARKPPALIISTPAVSPRLSSRPTTPSPLGRHASTSLFLNNDKDEDEGFGHPNPALLGTAGCTPLSSPMSDPSTPRLPTNPVWRNAYGLGSSSPGHALKQLPDLSGVMSQQLASSLPSPALPTGAGQAFAPSSPVVASASARPSLVEASAKTSVVTVRLHDSGVAHVSGDEVSIAQDGSSASASGRDSRAVAVMPRARVAVLAFVDKGVAYAKVARNDHHVDAPMSAPFVEHPPSLPPATPAAVSRHITGRCTTRKRTPPPEAGALSSQAGASSSHTLLARINACVLPISADDVADAGVTKARLSSTSLKSVYKAVIAALPDFGRGMLNVLSLATDLEFAESTTPGTITSSGRPLAIGQFKKNHYKIGPNVFKTIDAKYPELMWSWWLRVVGAQRPSVSVTRRGSAVTRPGPIRAGTNWNTLRLSGNCGLFDVVIGLLLWRMHIGSYVGPDSRANNITAWAELVLDVEDVLRDMVGLTVPVTSDVDANNLLPVLSKKRKPRTGGSLRKKIRRGST